MKIQSLILVASLSLTSLAQAEFLCVLDGKALKSSPLLIVKDVNEGGDQQTVTIFKNKDSHEKLLTVTADDKTEDVLAHLVNKKEGFEVSFYMDESDRLGMVEGSVKSKVMTGDIRCLYSEE